MLSDKLWRYSYLAADPTRSRDEEVLMWALRRELEAAGVEFDRDPVPRDADDGDADDGADGDGTTQE
jgi:hypothetical protein